MDYACKQNPRQSSTTSTAENPPTRPKDAAGHKFTSPRSPETSIQNLRISKQPSKPRSFVLRKFPTEVLVPNGILLIFAAEIASVRVCASQGATLVWFSHCSRFASTNWHLRYYESRRDRQQQVGAVLAPVPRSKPNFQNESELLLLVSVCGHTVAGFCCCREKQTPGRFAAGGWTLFVAENFASARSRVKC